MNEILKTDYSLIDRFLYKVISARADGVINNGKSLDDAVKLLVEIQNDIKTILDDRESISVSNRVLKDLERRGWTRCATRAECIKEAAKVAYEIGRDDSKGTL